MTKRLLTSITVVLAVMALARAEPEQHASPTPAEGSTDQLNELIVQPALCALAKEESLCRKPIAIYWRLAASASPCLYRSDAEEALHCWRQELNGKLNITIETESNIVFQLRDGETTLAEAVFQVLWEEQQRRRRRNPWQFF